MLDLLDGRFILLAGPGGTAWDAAAPEVAASLGIELAAYRIGSDGRLLDGEKSWQTTMGVSVEGAVLVRPDGCVAWRSSMQPKNPVVFLEQVLSRILCRPTTPTSLEEPVLGCTAATLRGKKSKMGEVLCEIRW